MSSGTIRFGLVGAGVAAATHAREIRKTDGGIIVAVHARDKDRAGEFARENAIPAVYDRLDEMLARPDLDAVIVTTPNGLHLETAIAAAVAGKHVVVEKPLEISEERASRIAAACRDNGVSLNVIYQRRYSQAAATALDDIQSGRLGKIILVNILDNQFRHPAYYSGADWRGTRSMEGGGCVITQATHLIDLAQYLAGPITRVDAITDTLFHSIETEDVAVATFRYRGGALGTFSASTAACPGLRHLLVVSGTQGSIIINGEHDQIIFRSVVGDATPSGIPAGFSFADPTNPRDYPTEGQRRQLQVIIDRLRTGRADDTGIRDALRNVRVVDAIYRSQATGQAIVLD